MRHGLTPGNEEHRYVGRRSDEALSERGRRECLEAGSLVLERVYASPLRRAVETARICCPSAQVVPVDGLEEMDFGVFDGRTAKEMEGFAAYRVWVDGGCVGRCPDGESLADFAKRSNSALEELLRACAKHGEQRVVAIVHGGTIMAALSKMAYVNGERATEEFFAWHVGTCEGYEARVRIQGERVELHDPRCFTHQRSWTLLATL